MILLYMRPGHIEFLENYVTQQLWLSVFFQNSMLLDFSAIFYVFHYVSVNYQFESTSYTIQHNIFLSIASRPCDILEYHTNGRPTPRFACFQFYPLCPVNYNFNLTNYILGRAWNARPSILGIRTRKNMHSFLVTTHYPKILLSLHFQCIQNFHCQFCFGLIHIDLLRRYPQNNFHWYWQFYSISYYIFWIYSWLLEKEDWSKKENTVPKFNYPYYCKYLK